jgi:predicted  nucleic acid-binding Zn-ribbon protein
VGGVVQAAEMRSRLEEKIRRLEKEKSLLLEEVKQLRELVELSEKAKELESEVGKLRSEVNALKEKIPREFLREFGESESPMVEEEEGEEETFEEECPGCDEDELF